MLIDGCSHHAKYSPECAAWLKGACVAASRLGPAAVSQQLGPKAQQQQCALINRLEKRVEEVSVQLH